MAQSPALAHHRDSGSDLAPGGDGLGALLAQRHSIRRLGGGPFPAPIRNRILRAATLTPAAYNRPPWHIVLLDEHRGEFWDLVEQACRDRLEADRFDRYLARLHGFRGGVAVLLIYEDRESVAAMRAAWRTDDDTTQSFRTRGWEWCS